LEKYKIKLAPLRLNKITNVIKYFIASIVTLFFIEGVYAQDVPQQNDARIAAIDKIKDEIKNKIDSYQKKEKYKDSTGYRNAYYNGDELQLAVTYYKDSASEKHGEWYFQNGQFIFSVKLWTDVKTKDTIDYERFYLINERLYAWFKFDNPIDRNTVVFKKLNFRMRDYIADLKLENQK
jgi:hypothetical protein